MRFSVNIPNFGDFADARVVARLAAAVEGAGWDGLFVWDHLVHVKAKRRVIADPWVLLTAAALATERIRLGTLVTPLARRRPQQVAKQVATLDRLTGGRMVLGVGLGAPVQDEYGDFGEPTDPRLLAARLDEGLGLVDRYWSGEEVTHSGTFYRAEQVTLLPTPVQRPRVPVWVAGYWPHRAPMRRAARWDGVVPLFETARHGVVPDPAQVRELVGFLGSPPAPHEVVLGGRTEPDSAADVLGPLAEAGATWWDERQPMDSPGLDSWESVLRRVEAGPPRV
ncbi:LLM class flavin-dependent oxidoreductase [Actinokineospora bangkokensis]|uniref:Luciferase n=1 Tax=Actinokineospora bangkokensis TaxID=1193682 RepID=A0A1Q9LJH9_9PSEU|nr:LLM class flavin-dependent oxidoreductase [Actinokineospora bangkokensis]OLR92201.1 luciferase [Actinokineospora bangkokensis]